MTRLAAAPGMTRRAAAWRAIGVALALAASGAVAQEREPAPQAPVEAAPVAPVGTAPARTPGLLETFGRWMDETGEGMRRRFDESWRSWSAIGGTAETAAKGTADAAVTVARGAADATLGTVDVLGRLGATRVVTGRERCAIAPNGAPDCRVAADALCKAKGFHGGSSVDYQTAENCPPQAFMNGRKPLPGECTLEHVVTKAVCQ